MKIILMILNIICTILGIIGSILPVMPGIPFFIMAAYLFSKSSQKLHQKLLSIPYIGSALKEWDEFGVMKMETKLSLILFCIISSGMSCFYYGFVSLAAILTINIAIIAIFSIIAIDTKSN